MINAVFGAADRRAQPDRPWPDGAYAAMQRKLISAVGLICIAIPLVAYVVNQTTGCFSDSISHFYYRALWGDLFVAAMAVAAGLLILFRSDTGIFDKTALLCGVLMLIVALVPTDGSGCAGDEVMQARLFAPYPLAEGVVPEFDGWGAAALHRAAAVALISVFLLLCLVGFTRVTEVDRAANGVCAVKRWRNRIYVFCGSVMALAMCAHLLGYLFLGEAQWAAWNGTFWVEFCCLLAFGLAWLVKGRVFDQLFKSPGE